jgi:hypothetical protein
MIRAADAAIRFEAVASNAYCRKRHGWARTATICSRSLLPESEFLLHKCNR